MTHAPRLTLNKHTMLNWMFASEEEVLRSKKVLMEYFKTLTKVVETDYERYNVSIHNSGDNFVSFLVSPLKKLYTLLLDKELRVMFASHVVNNKFVSKKDKDMRSALPITFQNGYKLCYGDKLFAIVDEKGQQTDLEWLHNIPLENGESVDIESKWNSVEISETERVEKNNTTYLSESQFIVFNPAVKIGDKEWQRIINIVADDYGYWDVKYYLVDCESKKCIDLNAFDHYHGMGGEYDAVWIADNQLVGYRHSGGEMIKENEQLFPPTIDRVTKMLKEGILRKFPMSTGFDGENTFTSNLDLCFNTTAFIDRCNS